MGIVQAGWAMAAVALGSSIYGVVISGGSVVAIVLVVLTLARLIHQTVISTADSHIFSSTTQ